MKIITEDCEGIVENDIDDYVCWKLDGSDYDRGKLEEIEKGLYLTSKCLGRLLNFLAETNRVSAKELIDIVEGGNDWYDEIGFTK